MCNIHYGQSKISHCNHLYYKGRPLYAYLKKSAIEKNLSFLKEKLKGSSSHTKVWATVKANAYGHGLMKVLPALSQADGIAVLDLKEAIKCQNFGWNKPIMVYGGLYAPSEIPLLFKVPNIHLVISHLAQLDWLKNSPILESQTLTSCTLWLRYHGDTHHCGFNEIDYQDAYNRAAELLSKRLINGIGHFNHYACAENRKSINDSEITFNNLIKRLPGETSTGNSAALLLYPEHCKDTNWVRPGLALYGASPIPYLSAETLGLEPAMSLHSELIAIQYLSAGDKVGYGGTFIASKDMKIGLISCGYGDGYPRHASTGTPILVDSTKTQLLGKVSMDISVVDLTRIPKAKIGTPVTLWGTCDLPVEEVAAAAGTIAAELFTRLSTEVQIIQYD
ncbi:MAG: alanine racemase [Bordetella sp.]|nr:MAG: alanine racemase [Bordetella sp.]